MSGAIRWLKVETILAFHDRLIAEHGGAPGLRDRGLLESAMARPRQANRYGKGDLFDLAGRYAEAICRNHPFVDGNKRAALVAAAVFLADNGVALQAPEIEAVQMTLGLAANEVTLEDYVEWLKARSQRGRE